MNNERKILFRGRTIKGKWIYGSLINTTNYLYWKPKQHTRTWISETSFGNGGWFNLQTREYVLPHTVGQFTGLQDKDGKDIYEGDIVYIAGYGDYEAEFPFIELYEAQMKKDIGSILRNIHDTKEQNENK